MNPAMLLKQHLHLFIEKTLKGPILDLACGDGRNGIFLASKGLSVILADASEDSLKDAEQNARGFPALVKIWKIDLEQKNINPFLSEQFGAILVFRYLHRPLVPCIKKALIRGGILIYETFTVSQAAFGKPRNPAHLLKDGELREWFNDWEIIHYFEGIEENPKRATARIVCRKPEK